MVEKAQPSDLMTVKELINRLGLSENKVQEMQRQNELPFPTIKIGGRVMFSRRAYNDWLAQFDFKGDTHEDHSRSPH